MVARLDVQFRVDDTTDQLQTNYNAGGASTVTLTHGLYYLSALATEIENQLQLVHASYGVEEDDGQITITATANFTVTWDHPGLRDWLGYSAALSGANSYLAPATSPGTHVFRHPADWEVDLRLHTLAWDSHHQRGSSIKTGNSRVFRPMATVSRADLTGTLRTVLGHMLRGTRARWWRDDTVAAAFDWDTQSDGHTDVVLDKTNYSDEWTNDTSLVWATLPLPLLEVT